MSNWSLNSPPSWFPNAVATSRGWENPYTGEVLVAIRNLATKAGAADQIRIVNASSSNLLKSGDKLTLIAFFNEDVTVTGSPRIPLTVNGATKYATYNAAAGIVQSYPVSANGPDHSGGGKSQLVFEWTVGSENAAAGQVVLADDVYGAVIDLNGGTIVDFDGHPAVLTIAPCSLANVVVDTTAPTITGTTVSGDLTTGTDLIVTLTCSTPVVVTGVPTLALTINGVSKSASYLSGSGTASLVFSYTIENAVACTAGQFSVSGSTLTGTITDLAGNALVATVPAGNQATVAITDTAAPTITSVVVPAAGAYKSGAVWTFQVVFSEPVTVSGTPRLLVTVGANSRQINYTAGTGTTTLSFPYTVVVGDAAGPNQVAVVSLGLNGGTIRDASGNNAILTFAAPDTSHVVADNVAPTVTGFGRMTGSYRAGSAINIPVIFSEPVAVTGTPYVPITINGVSKQAAFNVAETPNQIFNGAASQPGTLVFTYHVVLADVAQPGQFTIVSPINLNGGTIADAAGNAATLTFTPPSTTDVTVNS